MESEPSAGTCNDGLSVQGPAVRNITPTGSVPRATAPQIAISVARYRLLITQVQQPPVLRQHRRRPSARLALTVGTCPRSTVLSRPPLTRNPPSSQSSNSPTMCALALWPWQLCVSCRPLHFHRDHEEPIPLP